MPVNRELRGLLLLGLGLCQQHSISQSHPCNARLTHDCEAEINAFA